jgi:hypothetical protein
MDMHKDIRATIIRQDEAKSTILVERYEGKISYSVILSGVGFAPAARRAMRQKVRVWNGSGSFSITCQRNE